MKDGSDGNGRHKESYRPDSLQRLLLQAAVGQGEQARQAWLSWRAVADIEKLDNGSYGLLPQVWQNLLSLGLQDVWFPRMQGVYRLTAVKNRLQLLCLAELAREFESSGLPLLTLGETPFLLFCQESSGVYSLPVMNVMIRRSDIDAAAKILAGTGWTPDRQDWRSRAKVARGSRFVHKKGALLQVDWRDPFIRVEADLWNGAVSASVNEATVLVMPPSDLFIRNCLQASIWNDSRTFRWMADAMTLLRSNPEWDWTAWIGRLDKYHRGGAIAGMLGCLEDVMPGTIPPTVFAGLSRHAGNGTQRRIARALACPPSLSPWCVLGRWRLFSQAFAELGPIWRLRYFPAYLANAWGLENIRQIPGQVTRRIHRG